MVNSRDITDRKKLEEERSRLLVREEVAQAEADANRRLNLLAEASSLISSSLDYETNLAAVAHLSVPYLADWCFIHEIDEGGVLQRLAVSNCGPEDGDALRALQSRRALELDPSGTFAKLIGTGKPELVSELGDDALLALAGGNEQLALVRGLGFRSALIVPLMGLGRPLGCITLVFSDPSRSFGPSRVTVPLVETVDVSEFPRLTSTPALSVPCQFAALAARFAISSA